MEKLHQEDLQFVTKTLLAMVLIMLMIALIDIILMRKTVTGPIDCMKQTTDRFAYETESDHKENIRIMEELDIHTGDEIEDIYHLFITFMKNNLRYMENLHKAETDIRHKDEQIGQISQEAYRDTLTGVGSKTAYIHKVEELNRAIGDNDTPFAVVMVDMNDLKQINDVYGHKAGDLYIKGCCAMVCEVYKHSPVFRIGGDEFVVLLQGKDHEARNELLTTIRAAFAESCGKQELDPWLRYSASVGMAERTADDSQFETVFKRADEAMYEEKKQFKAVHGSYR
jgi:diguanylate cyclase (GGDEF)-like protein